MVAKRSQHRFLTRNLCRVPAPSGPDVHCGATMIKAYLMVTFAYCSWLTFISSVACLAPPKPPNSGSASADSGEPKNVAMTTATLASMDARPVCHFAGPSCIGLVCAQEKCGGDLTLP